MRIDRSVFTILRKGKTWAEYLIDVHFIRAFPNEEAYAAWNQDVDDRIMLQTPYEITDMSGDEYEKGVFDAETRAVYTMEFFFDITLDRADLEIFGKLLELVIGGADNVKAVTVTWRDSRNE